VVVLGGLAAGFGVVAGVSLVPWGLGGLSPALREGSFVSIGSPWRAVRSAVRLAAGEGVAEDLVKAAAVLLALVLLALLLRSASQARPGSWPQVPGLVPPGRWLTSKDLAGPGPGGGGPAALVLAASFSVVFAWLVAWPYVLPWYDGLGWAFLAVLPVSRLDWLMLARTTALAVGYLPGRAAVVMPADLGWLRTVVRTGVTPVILLAVTIALVVLLWPRGEPSSAAPPPGDAGGNHSGAVSNQRERLA
jgi:hypothetical protein